MNKYKLSLVIIITAFLSFVQISNTFATDATEGTCSSHGGINCTAMADFDGSAICNDGWRDSSELYFEMEECKINRHTCKQNESSQIDSKYNLDGKQKVMTDLTDQLRKLNEQSTSLSNTVQNSNSVSDLRNESIQQADIANQSLLILSQYKAAEADFWNAQNQAERECYALGDTEFYQSQADFYKQFQSLFAQPQNTPQYSCPANSTLNTNNSCSCDSGYAVYKNQCISIANYCAINYGVNSYAQLIDGAYRCACNTGYAWDQSGTTCNQAKTISKYAMGMAKAAQCYFISDANEKAACGDYVQNSNKYNWVVIDPTVKKSLEPISQPIEAVSSPKKVESPIKAPLIKPISKEALTKNLKDDKIKATSSEVVAASPDKKFEVKNYMETKQNFFSNFLGSLISFFSKIFK